MILHRQLRIESEVYSGEDPSGSSEIIAIWAM
jgi:hypothetical protein